MTFENWFQSTCPEIPLKSAMTVLRLAEEGGTIPFIARYRKEATGNLNEVAIAKTLEEFEKFNEIQKRQAYIVKEIEAQQKLTPELKEKVMSTFDWAKLDDLFLPFKKKKKTKAALAKEAGLEPLADWIWNIGHGTEKPQEGQTLDLWALTFRNEEKGIKDAESAIAGACDIIVERLSEKQELRQYVRDLTFKEGVIKTGKGEKAKENSKYENYFNYHEPIQALLSAQASHRYLAIRRGWMEGEITLGVGAAPADNSFDPRMYEIFEKEACTDPNTPTKDI